MRMAPSSFGPDVGVWDITPKQNALGGAKQEPVQPAEVSTHLFVASREARPKKIHASRQVLSLLGFVECESRTDTSEYFIRSIGRSTCARLQPRAPPRVAARGDHADISDHSFVRVITASLDDARPSIV